MNRRPIFLALIFWMAFVTTAQAEVFRGPLSSALAGTGRAGMDGSEAGLLNPALVAVLKNYEFDGYYRDGSLADGQHRQSIGLGAGDNGPDVLFPGTLAYIRGRDDGRASGPADSEFIHLGIGRRIGDNFALGISGYRLSYNVIGDQQYVQWNYALGALVMFTPDIGVGYVLNNLAKPSSTVPTDLREDLQQGIGFFASAAEIARARIDVTRNEVNNPQQKMVYMASLESQNGHWGIVRVGYRRDDQIEHNFLTAGFGFNGPRLKFDYSFEKQLEGASGALHSVDLRLPF